MHFGTRLRRILAMAVLAALLGGTLWYTRPVDLYTLAPGLEPQYLDLMLMRHTGDAADIPARSLMLTAEDGAAYDTVLARLESLRFRRLPLGSLLSFLRDQQSRTIHPGDFESWMGLSDGTDSLGLNCRLGWWELVTYPDSGPSFQAVLLCGGGEVGTDFHEFLWDIASEIESNS